MNIDIYNWYILEGDLNEEQYIDVVKYLVGNFTEGRYSAKIHSVVKWPHETSTQLDWDMVGVVHGECASGDFGDDSGLEQTTRINYQDFVKYIKGGDNLNQEDNGWIEWANTDRNDVSPVDSKVKVEVELRNGSVREGLAGDFSWGVDSYERVTGDIMRYRVVKEPEQPSEPQSDQTQASGLVSELKRTSEFVKRFGEVTGSDLYFGADGLVTIEHNCVEYEIDFDKVSEQEAQSLVDALTTLSSWFNKKIETGGVFDG